MNKEKIIHGGGWYDWVCVKQQPMTIAGDSTNREE